MARLGHIFKSRSFYCAQLSLPLVETYVIACLKRSAINNLPYLTILFPLLCVKFPLNRSLFLRKFDLITENRTANSGRLFIAERLTLMRVINFLSVDTSAVETKFPSLARFLFRYNFVAFRLQWSHISRSKRLVVAKNKLDQASGYLVSTALEIKINP
jgi:hypothetical protein